MHFSYYFQKEKSVACSEMLLVAMPAMKSFYHKRAVLAQKKQEGTLYWNWREV